MILKKALQNFFILTCIVTSVANAKEIIDVENAWLREAPPVSRVNAAYMTLHNRSNKDITLESVVSRFYDHAMIHLTVTKNGISRMLHQDQLVIPAHGKATLQPDGLHMMLMRPISPLREGDEVFVKLNFSNQPSMFIKVPVLKTAPK